MQQRFLFPNLSLFLLQHGCPSFFPTFHMDDALICELSLKVVSAERRLMNGAFGSCKECCIADSILGVRFGKSPSLPGAKGKTMTENEKEDHATVLVK